MNTYSSTVKKQMLRFYKSLNQQDRRRYAAIEAIKFGHGGIEYISNVLKCDPKTISRGINELEDEVELSS
ncbi:hypothetical protein L2734_06820 [Parashewanella spongiae]|uniref:hypothetical protein n=1 Tax=Parashewanella spongiae TaxID=342950 RepID=UPI001059A51F|nr:hypothetical protein [Parashewanella spongiae]MCL1077885.1 hypothetical protein [Parashewanella spongiae]